MANTQNHDISTYIKIAAWIDNIVPWQGTEAQALDELHKNAEELRILAIEKNAKWHCKWLGRIISGEENRRGIATWECERNLTLALAR